MSEKLLYVVVTALVTTILLGLLSVTGDGQLFFADDTIEYIMYDCKHSKFYDDKFESFDADNVTFMTGCSFVQVWTEDELSDGSFEITLWDVELIGGRK